MTASAALTRRSSGGPVTLQLAGTAAYAADATTARLVKVLGSNTVAELVGVARDRPGRWVRGTDRPAAANRAALADLDALVGRLLVAFTPAQAGLWLDGANLGLGGARPVDVYRVRGAGPVLEAIAAHEQGAFV